MITSDDNLTDSDEHAGVHYLSATSKVGVM